MEELIIFYNTYGWQLALIALLGIVILGVLKYTNAFKKIEKPKRKPIYLAITVGFSLIATCVFLAATNQFNVEYLVAVTTAIYGLNQIFYTIYENTKLRDLMVLILEIIKQQIQKKGEKITTEDKQAE